MKVSLNQTTNINQFTSANQNRLSNLQAQNNNPIESKTREVPSMALSLANFPNVSFGVKMSTKTRPETQFLLAQAKWLKCAYSNTTMILPEEAKIIYEKLAKRPNAQSAVNFLQQYQKIMHDIESQIFDIFVDAPYKAKRDFQDILQEYKPEALERLKVKQKEILTSTDKIIPKLSPQAAEQVIQARDTVLETVENGPFRRDTALNLIQSIIKKADPSDVKRLKQIHRAWYKLPKSSNDLDAFIVKYAYQPHNIIAKRLICGSVATIEHIKPASRRGEDNLGNYLLVAAEYNSNRSSLPLGEYIELNKQINIAANLQKYMDSVIENVNDKRTAFYHRSFYPELVKETLQKETNGLINLNTSRLKLSKEQIKENEAPQKLADIYRVISN